MKAELFIIEPGVWKAADREEVSATCEALQELGLYHLPYNTVTEQVLAHHHHQPAAPRRHGR